MAQASSLAIRINLLLEEEAMQKNSKFHKRIFVQALAPTLLVITSLAAIVFSMPTIALSIAEDNPIISASMHENNHVSGNLKTLPNEFKNNLNDEANTQDTKTSKTITKLETSEVSERATSPTTTTERIDQKSNENKDHQSDIAINLTLEQANLAFDNKDYQRAFRLYDLLAKQEYVEAQAKFGEMYWYGEGTDSNPASAKFWFTKAASKAHLKAQKFLDMFTEREKRQADISYYTDHFSGGNLQWRAQNCKHPELATIDLSHARIKDVVKGHNDWLACYNDYVHRLQDLSKNASHLPEDLAQIMTKEELRLAKHKAIIVYKENALIAQNEGKNWITSFDAWDQNLASMLRNFASRGQSNLVNDLVVRTAGEDRNSAYTRQYSTLPAKQ